MTNADVQTILDHITSERRKVENYINDELEKTNTKVDALQRGVSGLKKDVSVLKEDVSVLKEDVSVLKEDVSVLKEDVSDLKEDVSTLTDAVIEGFDNTERVLSDWEGKPVTLVSKQTRNKLEKNA